MSLSRRRERRHSRVAMDVREEPKADEPLDHRDRDQKACRGRPPGLSLVRDQPRAEQHRSASAAAAVAIEVAWVAGEGQRYLEEVGGNRDVVPADDPVPHPDLAVRQPLGREHRARAHEDLAGFRVAGETPNLALDLVPYAAIHLGDLVRSWSEREKERGGEEEKTRGE